MIFEAPVAPGSGPDTRKMLCKYRPGEEEVGVGVPPLRVIGVLFSPK